MFGLCPWVINPFSHQKNAPNSIQNRAWPFRFQTDLTCQNLLTLNNCTDQLADTVTVKNTRQWRIIEVQHIWDSIWPTFAGKGPSSTRWQRPKHGKQWFQLKKKVTPPLPDNTIMKDIAWLSDDSNSKCTMQQYITLLDVQHYIFSLVFFPVPFSPWQWPIQKHKRSDPQQ